SFSFPFFFSFLSSLSFFIFTVFRYFSILRALSCSIVTVFRHFSILRTLSLFIVTVFWYFPFLWTLSLFIVTVFRHFSILRALSCSIVTAFRHFSILRALSLFIVTLFRYFSILRALSLFHCYPILIIPRYTSTIFIQAKSNKKFSIVSIHLKILRPLVFYFVNTRFLKSYEKLNRSGIKNPLTTATKHCNKRILFILFGWAFPIQHTASHISSSIPIVF